MKKVIFLVFITTIIILLKTSCLCKNDDPGLTIGEEVKLQLTVIENITKHLAVDGGAYFKGLLEDKYRIDVWYQFGDRPYQNFKMSDIGISLNPGEQVEVFGKVKSSNSISLYGKKNEKNKYYLKKIADIKEE